MPSPTLLARFRSLVGGRGAAALCLILFSLELGYSQGPHAATIITFDAPGAGTGAGQGTIALFDDARGAIL